VSAERGRERERESEREREREREEQLVDNLGRWIKGSDVVCAPMGMYCTRRAH
jgi:hypothetical protein